MYLADYCDLNPGSCICWLRDCQENDFSFPTLSFLCVVGTAVVSCHKRTWHSAWPVVHASDRCCCHGPLLFVLNQTLCWGQFTGMRNMNTKMTFPYLLWPRNTDHRKWTHSNLWFWAWHHYHVVHYEWVGSLAHGSHIATSSEEISQLNKNIKMLPWKIFMTCPKC